MVPVKELLWALAISIVLASPVVGFNPAIASFGGLQYLALWWRWREVTYLNSGRCPECGNENIDWEIVLGDRNGK